jgi:phosphoribosylformimino-5-aminoimidazole carboxamide ribotide isomerase
VIIFPAIDLRGGKCVRLRQGDYAQETVFADDPVAIARGWQYQGAEYLHLVDLDGAKEGKPVNGAVIQAITRAVDIPCQLGGGLRTEHDIQEALAWGIERIVIGTRALEDPAWVESMCRRYSHKIVLGIDAKNGKVATAAWLDVSEKSALDLARQCAGWPLLALVYTDISKDGMMQGPNLPAMHEMVQTVPLPVIASGGVTSVEDIRRLARLGLSGCIVGRALYEGRIQLPQALLAARDISSSG